jgi:hypothetical protein
MLTPSDTPGDNKHVTLDMHTSMGFDGVSGDYMVMIEFAGQPARRFSFTRYRAALKFLEKTDAVVDEETLKRLPPGSKMFKTSDIDAPDPEALMEKDGIHSVSIDYLREHFRINEDATGILTHAFMSRAENYFTVIMKKPELTSFGIAAVHGTKKVDDKWFTALMYRARSAATEEDAIFEAKMLLVSIVTTEACIDQLSQQTSDAAHKAGACHDCPSRNCPRRDPNA